MTYYTDPHYDRSALVVIDMQRDFLSDRPYGFAGTTEIIPRLRSLLAACRAAGRPVVHAVRLYRPEGTNADLCRREMLESGVVIVHPGTEGAQLAAGLTPDPDDPSVSHGIGGLDAELLLAGRLQPIGPAECVMYKPRWSAFFGTVLEDHLRSLGVDTVVVAGCNYPNCPRATFFDATARDFRTVAAADAISAWRTDAAEDLSRIGVLAVSVEEIARGLTGATAASGRPG